MLDPRVAVKNIKRYEPPLSGRDGLRLDFNENTTGCSPRVLERLRSLSAESLAIYPERASAERMIADFLGVTTSSVLLTNGVDEAIHLVCETFLEPGDEVLLAVPTFAMYEVSATATGATVVTVPCDADFAFPTSALLVGINARTRLIAIANPNNPTGAIVCEHDLLAIAEAAPNAAILVDEAYFEFYGKSLLAHVAELKNLFLARTFSKAYGLAALRVGVLVGPPEQMTYLQRVASPYNVNGLALACLTEALADRAYVARYVAGVQRGRRALENALRSLGVPFWPSQANFVLARIGERHREFVGSMRARGILVRDRNSDPGCAGCVRMTVGTDEHTNVLLAALPECLREISWAPNAAEVHA